MTFAMTSDVDDARPSATDVEVTSANEVAEYIGETCLTDGPVGQVGLEVEAHCFNLTDPMRRPGWDELQPCSPPAQLPVMQPEPQISVCPVESGWTHSERKRDWPANRKQRGGQPILNRRFSSSLPGLICFGLKLSVAWC